MDFDFLSTCLLSPYDLDQCYYIVTADNSKCDLRQAIYLFKIRYARTDVLKCSYFFRVAKSWNSLPLHSQNRNV